MRDLGAQPAALPDQEPAALVVQRTDMRTATFSPAHASTARGWRAGAGSAEVRWLLEPTRSRGSVVHEVLESLLEPGASVGLHRHVGTEEVYVLLAGELTVHVEAPDGTVSEHDLSPGDLHHLPENWSHAALAGPGGARLLAVVLRAATP